MVAFESVEWPQRKRVGGPKSPPPPVLVEDDEGNQEEVTVDFSQTAETIDTEQTDDNNNDTPPADDDDDASKQQQSAGSSPSDDDPQTREPVHPAVETTLEAFMAVLGHPSKSSNACELALDGITRLVSKRYVSGRAGGRDDTSGSGSKPAEEEEEERKPASLLHRILESVAKQSGDSGSIEPVQSAVVKTLRNIMTSPKCGVHEASMLLALRTTFHVYLVTKSQSCKDAAKLALIEMLRSVFSRMEAYHAVARTLQKEARRRGDEDSSTTTPSSSTAVVEVIDDMASITSAEVSAVSSFASQYHADSYTLFRSLCKLSSKELPADTTVEPDKPRLFNTQIPTDPLALNSKILSLELILAAMDFCGDAFCQGERFVYLVQHYLCVSLLKNCVSHHTRVAALSQKIFLVLVRTHNPSRLLVACAACSSLTSFFPSRL